MSELTGKVAIVTGAGRGLGRVEAIQLARQGARVVINEIGLPAAREAAESAREEIRAFGGEAITVYGDCADWNDSEALFKTAIDTFGDVNIVVNNAGFCRDKMIFSMTEEEFDSVVRVHLKGHFVNMRHAAAYWREKAKTTGGTVYGRLVSTSSEAFLYGSVGQPNYAAAKAGIVAMTMGAAQALVKYGVTANVIMPRARTDMTMGGGTAALFEKPAEGFDHFDPGPRGALRGLPGLAARAAHLGLRVRGVGQAGHRGRGAEARHRVRERRPVDRGPARRGDVAALRETAAHH